MMMTHKKRALELLELMAKLDPDGAGVSMVQLRRASGHSRSRLESSLLWLLTHDAVRRTTDQAKLWVRVPDEEPDQEPLSDPISLDDLGLSNTEEILSSLTQ